MSQPRYRKPEHTEAERRIIEYLRPRWPVEYEQQSPQARANLRMYVAGRLVAIAEARGRHCSITSHDTLMLDERKVDGLRGLQQTLDVPAVFIPSWVPFEVRWLTLDELDALRLTPRMGGRRDRPHDPQAKEPCYYVPISLMHLVESDAPPWKKVEALTLW